MSTAATPAALFGGPTLLLNGKRYASASPQQFALWPYPYAATPTAASGSYRGKPGPNVLLLREVGEGIPAKLGPIFWTSVEIPAGFEEASRRQGVRPSSEMCA